MPKIILAKKRSKHQPLLNYTSSRILTSRDYITGLEELLVRKEATVAAAKKKKRTMRSLKSNGRLQKNNKKKLKECAHERARKKIRE